MSHKEQRSRKMSWACASALVAALAVSCGFDRGDRWLPDEGRGGQPACELDAQRCGDGIERCVTTTEGVGWVTIEDCDAQGKVCAPSLLKCTDCVPDAVECDEQTPRTCSSDGSGFVSSGSACDTQPGVACRSGTCTDLCASAAERRSNVGCEYWAVDLDNAMIDDSLNAAAQQFAVVVSNPQPDLSATVTIEQDDSAVGAAGAPTQVASAEVPPLGLRVFKLGPREVDGSPEGEYNTGSHTALTRQAYRVTSTVPIIAYQFNPLENVNVFSNDASLLKPVEALTYDPGTLSNAYVVLGWPQTIASTDDPATNFNPNNPIDLRSFVTIVATREATSIRVRPTARIIGSDSVPSIDAGGELSIKLEPFEVLNLETDDFNADFTGSAIDADQPIVVFSGGEASDAPFFDSLSGRQCCADHLEEQLDPRRTAGRRFVATVSANRTRALSEAGASIATVTQTDHFRVIAATERGANITTTLNGAFTELSLAGLGSFVDIDATRDFVLESDEPIQLGNISASQNAAGVARGLPGGDPSFLIVPPAEQFRNSYVFLTPDKYLYDFIRIIAPPDTGILLDGSPLSEAIACETSPGDGLTEAERGSPTPPFVVHRCQLSFPVIDPDEEAPDNVSPGLQDDGVHRIDAERPVGVLVEGFDSFVSYAYAAGTELESIVPR